MLLFGLIMYFEKTTITQPQYLRTIQETRLSGLIHYIYLSFELKAVYRTELK